MIDMAGLAQKGGAVFSHVKLARRARRHPRHPRRGRRRRSDSGLRSRGVGRARKCSPRCAAPRPASSSTAPKSIPAISRAIADFSLPGERLKRAILAASGGAAKFVDADRRGQCAASAMRSAPTCSCSATPIRPATCRCRRGDPPRDRTQRRSGGDESRRLRLGPRGVRRSAGDRRGSRRARAAPASRTELREQIVARRADVPRRLSEPRLCRALRGACRADRRGRAPTRARRRRPRRSRSRAICSS